MIKVVIEASSQTDLQLAKQIVEILDKLGVQSTLRVTSAYRKHPQSHEPYFRVNILTGFKRARMIEDATEYAHLIKRARRPLLVLGPRTLTTSLNGRLLIEYAAEIAKAINMPVCSTAHTKKKLLELGLVPDCSYDIIEIINHLKHSEWKGVRKEGNHDLVVFLGIRCDLAEQGLSTLKHFAPHLRTMTLCQNYHPNADYSLPNFKIDAWNDFLVNLIAHLKKSEE